MVGTRKSLAKKSYERQPMKEISPKKRARENAMLSSDSENETEQPSREVRKERVGLRERIISQKTVQSPGSESEIEQPSIQERRMEEEDNDWSPSKMNRPKKKYLKGVKREPKDESDEEEEISAIGLSEYEMQIQNNIKARAKLLDSLNILKAKENLFELGTKTTKQQPRGIAKRPKPKAPSTPSEKKKESMRKMMMEIIDVYRSLPALWKIKSDEYRNQEKRADAYKILYGKYKEHYPNATLEEMKIKINSLRRYFRAELHKVERSEKSGAGIEDIYVPRLWYFDAMLFLRDQKPPAPSTSSIMVPEESHEGQKESYTEQDERSVGLNQGVTTTKGVPIESCCKRSNEEKSTSLLTLKRSVPLTGKEATAKRRWEEAKKNELITLATNSLLKESLEDEHDIQGKVWANQLRKMDPMQQLFAKKVIDDVLFEGRCGNLSRNSVKINQTNVVYAPTSSMPHSLSSYADNLSRTSTPNSMHSTHSPSSNDTSHGFQSNVEDANETDFVGANPLAH